MDATNVFFEAYRTAFEAGAPDRIAEYVSFPCHVTTDGGRVSVAVIADKGEWLRIVTRILDGYRAIGVASIRIRGVDTRELSPNLEQAVVAWALHDRAGVLLYSFEAMYTLARLEADLKIVAIARNERRRYKEYRSKVGAG